MTDVIRIVNCSGFYGDRLMPLEKWKADLLTCSQAITLLNSRCLFSITNSSRVARRLRWYFKNKSNKWLVPA